MGISLPVHISAKVKKKRGEGGGGEMPCSKQRRGGGGIDEGSGGKAARMAVAHRAPAVNTSCDFVCMCQRMIRIY